MIKYQDYKMMINKICWKWHNTSNMEFEELVGEANLIFAQCIHKYNAKRSKFSTLLYHSINNHFKNIITQQKSPKYKRNDINFLEECYASHKNNAENKCILKNTIEMMSAEAQSIISIVLNAPMDLLKMLPNQSINAHQLTKYLSQKGWDKSTIFKSIKEIKTNLQQNLV